MAPDYVEHLQVIAAVIISVPMPCLRAGFRGGFIFPTFFAGTAFGHAVWRAMDAIPGIESWFGSMPPVLFCMTVAVGKSHSCVTHRIPLTIGPSRSPGVPLYTKTGIGLQHCKVGTPQGESPKTCRIRPPNSEIIVYHMLSNLQSGEGHQAFSDIAPACPALCLLVPCVWESIPVC